MSARSPRRPAAPGGPPDPPPKDAEAVAGLARELDGLRKRVEPLDGLREQVEGVEAVLVELSDAVEALIARRSPTPCPTWLSLPADEPAARRVLDELAAWLPAVFLRYPDGQQALPECWAYHPELVEELLWLMHAWLAAYQGPAASVGLAADWHERHRPGAVRRIRQAAGSCSVENHLTREGRTRYPAEAPTLPGVEAIPAVAAWWGPRREQPAPEPQPEAITRRSHR